MCGPGKKREEDGERQRYLGDYTLGHANTYGKIECWCGPLRFFQKSYSMLIRKSVMTSKWHVKINGGHKLPQCHFCGREPRKMAWHFGKLPSQQDLSSAAGVLQRKGERVEYSI